MKRGFAILRVLSLGMVFIVIAFLLWWNNPSMVRHLARYSDGTSLSGREQDISARSITRFLRAVNRGTHYLADKKR